MIIFKLKEKMKHIYIIPLILLLCGCKSHKEISTDIDYTDTTKSEITDSVHTSTDIGYIQDINDSIVTTVTERITEVVRDSNNTVTERLIERVINTQRGNSINTQFNVVTDSVRASGEVIDEVIAFKDNSNSIESKDTEIDNIVLWVFLSICIVVVVLGIYWGYKLL